MNNDISELLSTVHFILKDDVRECPTPTTQFVNGIWCVITRCAKIKHDIQIPNDLKEALNNDLIQPRYLPKDFIREYLHVLLVKDAVLLICEINIHRNKGKAMYEDTFEFKIIKT